MTASDFRIFDLIGKRDQEQVIVCRDIFAPCAMGGIINEATIPRLKCGMDRIEAIGRIRRTYTGHRHHILGPGSLMRGVS